MKKTLHLMPWDKFIPSFIAFVHKNFDQNDHVFLILGRNRGKYGQVDFDNVMFITGPLKWLYLIGQIHRANKLIIHGLWSRKLVRVLFLCPWLLEKSYWIVWGGDFFPPRGNRWIKKRVIKNMGHLVTDTTGDVMLIRQWYGATGEHIRSWSYTSNIYRLCRYEANPGPTVNILAGNSANPTNNHFDIFDKLKLYKNQDIKIYTPLSYSGKRSYVEEVIGAGMEEFGDKFAPLTEFIPFDEYLQFLATIDIAIFNHERQQAMGNIVTLLGFGKKVYLNHASPLNTVFEEYKIKIYDAEDISLEAIDGKTKEENIQRVKNHFSEENLIESLRQFIVPENA